MDVSLEDIQRALDSMAGAFANAPAEGGSIYDPPPDNDYQALIHEFTFHGWEPKGTKPGGIGMRVTYQVTNSKMYAGRLASTMFNLTDEGRIGYLKGWLSLMGVDVESFDVTTLRPGPGSILNGLLDVPVLIRVRRKDGYVNVYLQERLGDAVQRSDVTDTQAAMDFAGIGGANQYVPADDDIPF